MGSKPKYAPSNLLGEYGTSKEFAQMKEIMKQKMIDFFYKSDYFDRKGTISKSDVERSLDSFLLSDEALWGDLTEQYLTNPNKFEKGLASFISTIKSRGQRGGEAAHKVVKGDPLHHRHSMRSAGPAARLQTPNVLREFLEISRSEGRTYADTASNYGRAGSVDARSHGGDRGHPTAKDNYAKQSLGLGQEGDSRISMHPRGYSDPLIKLEERVYGSGQEMYDAFKPQLELMESDFELGTAADQPRRLFYNEHLVNAGILDAGEDAWDPNLNQQKFEKVQKYIKKNPALQKAGAEVFTTPNPQDGYIKQLWERNKRLTQGLQGTFGTVGALAVNPVSAEGAGNITKDLMEGEGVKGEDVAQVGTGIAIEGAKVGALALAGKALLKGGAGKVAGTVLGGPVGWGLGLWGAYEAADVYTKAATGTSLTERAETAYEDVKPEWLKKREEEQSYYGPGTPAPAPTSRYKLPPHAGAANPYMNNFQAP